MAIKPNDCVIKIENLIIGYEPCRGQFSEHTSERPVYEPYWANFLEHVERTCPQRVNMYTYDNHFVSELAKFNAVMKETKKWDDRYIKFKTHSDLTFFVLRWQ